jgi:tetratricopeptide (TPR) repeat protein
MSLAPPLLALLLAAPPGGDDRAAVRFRDHFEKDTLKSYVTDKEVKWERGQVTLGKGALLGHEVALGNRAEVRAVVRFPAGDGIAGLAFALGAEGILASVALECGGGRRSLVNLEEPVEQIPLASVKEAPRAREWVLRMEVRQGVVRARAWPMGTPEPKGWMTTRYAGWYNRPLSKVAIGGGGEAGGVLVSLEVTGEAPPAPPPEKLRARAKQAADREREAGGLFEQGKFPQAVPKYRAALETAREVHGADHLNLANSLLMLGLCHLSAAQPREALAAWQKCLAICQKELGAEHPQTATCLDNIGTALTQLGKPDEAVKYNEQALAAYVKVCGPDHVDTLLCRMNLGTTLLKAGDHTAARKHLEAALAGMRKPPPAQRLLQAVTLANLGVVCREQGELPVARRHLEEAQRLQEGLPPDHRERLQTLNNLATVLYAQGDLPAARRLHKQVLDVRQKTLRPDHPDLGESLFGLAEVLEDLGEREKARPLLEKALDIHQKSMGNDHPDTVVMRAKLANLLYDLGEMAAMRPHLQQLLTLAGREVRDREATAQARRLTELGGLLLNLGDYPQARSCLERALELYRRQPGTEAAQARVLSLLSVVLGSLGVGDEALRRAEESVGLSRKHLSPNHPETAHSLGALGMGLLSVQRPREAKKVLEEAVEAARKAYGPDQPDTAINLSYLAHALQSLGEHDRAAQCFRESLEIFERRLGKEHPYVAMTLSYLGYQYRLQRKLKEARTHYKRALAIAEKKCGPEHPLVAMIRHHLGMLACAEGDRAEGWRQFAAATTLRARQLAGWTALSGQKDSTDISGLLRVEAYELFNLAERDPGLASRGGKTLLSAVLDFKGGRSRAVAERQEALVLGQDRQALAHLEELRAARARLNALLLQGPGEGPPESFRERVEELRGKADRLERDLAERVRGYTDVLEARRATPEDLAQRLAPGEVLVEFVRYGRYDPAKLRQDDPHRGVGYGALLVWRPADGKKPFEVRLAVLGSEIPITRGVGAWREAVAGGKVDDRAEARLRQLVWEPLARALPPKTKRLYLAPEGVLCLVPFEAIRLADGRYLVEEYEVSYLSSGRDLVPRPGPKERGKTALVLADPDYDAVPEESGSPGLVSTPGPELARRKVVFQSLPGFASEAKAVARLLRRRPGWDVQVKQKGQATEETLAGARRPRLLYCVTHGFFLDDLGPLRQSPTALRELELVDVGPARPRMPRRPRDEDPWLRSGLALAGANRWQERTRRGLSDGLLTALEVQNLDLWGTELVVLSACETGHGKVEWGEGVLGLRLAFQQAGAETVLASLWPVPDAETEKLMAAFLENWLAGKGKAEALRRAQLELIRQLRTDKDPMRRTAPPLYWAGFICHGQAR